MIENILSHPSLHNLHVLGAGFCSLLGLVLLHFTSYCLNLQHVVNFISPITVHLMQFCFLTVVDATK